VLHNVKTKLRLGFFRSNLAFKQLVDKKKVYIFLTKLELKHKNIKVYWFSKTLL